MASPIPKVPPDLSYKGRGHGTRRTRTYAWREHLITQNDTSNKSPYTRKEAQGEVVGRAEHVYGQPKLEGREGRLRAPPSFEFREM